MSFYGYCGSNVQKLHRSRQSHRMKKKCYSTNTYTGKKGILQITMIYDCMGARGVGKLEEREKDCNRDSSSAFLKSVHREFSQLRQAFPSPSWKDQDWRLASKNKLLLSWSSLHRLTNNIPSPIPFISLSNSEGIRKFSQMWLVAADHTYMPILNVFFFSHVTQSKATWSNIHVPNIISLKINTYFLPSIICLKSSSQVISMASDLL